MRAFRRTAAAVACMSALLIAAPAAVAQQGPATAAASRTAAEIPVDTPVYLVETATNSSAGIEVYANYDYVQLTRDSGRLVDGVIFHRKGAGYIIEHTTGHWDNHRFWESSHSALWSGVRLGTRESATVYVPVFTDKGFALQDPANGDKLTYANSSSKKWVYSGSLGTGGRSTAYFRTQAQA
ncbi:hypothetical protein ACIP88_33795 [Streptomyces uncialis]|uniref:hypothetical protein n=1 Tax=Streptomyces uncialis TaxID=1048205 RepID=UPI00382497A7